MNDDNDKKVVDLFSAHNSHKKAKTTSSQKVSESPEGYFYVTIKADDKGRHFDEDKLRKNAENFYYLVKVMVKEDRYPYIRSFKIPGENLLDFIKTYIDGKADGQIIEIDKFYQEDWA